MFVVALPLSKDTKSIAWRSSMAASKSDQIREMLGKGIADADIAKKVGCSRNLVYIVKSKMSKGTGPRRGPGRPKGSTSASTSTSASVARASSSMSTGGLDDLLTSIRNIQNERDSLRGALENIREVLNRVLA